MAVAVRLIGHTGADGDVLGLDDRLRRGCGGRLRRGIRLVLHIDERAAQAVVTVGRRRRRSCGCSSLRGCRLISRLLRRLRRGRRHRRGISGLFVVRIGQCKRLGEVARIVKGADSQLLKLVHIRIQLHVQHPVCQRGEQHTVDLHTCDAGQIIFGINLKGCAVDGRGQHRRCQINALHLRAFLKRMTMRISHAQGEGAVFMERQLCTAICKQVFAVHPVPVVHPIFDFLPAQPVLVRDGHLHDGSVAARPTTRRSQDDSVRRDAFHGHLRGSRRTLRDSPNGRKSCCTCSQHQKHRHTQRQNSLTHRHHHPSPPRQAASQGHLPRQAQPAHPWAAQAPACPQTWIS